MLENLVIAPQKPYHRLFSAPTIKVAQERMADLGDSERDR